jgi:hypothetical protein
MKILFFAPHAAIWVPAFPEALIAEALQQKDHDIVYVSCGGTLDHYCVPMSAQGLVPGAPANARQKVCAQCNQNDRIVRDEFAFKGPRLNELVGPGEKQEAQSILAHMTRDGIPTLERDGVFLGRLALYQLMLRRKLMTLHLNDTEWEEYLVELRNTLYAWQAGRKLLDQERPDRVMVYNGLYSVNRAVCKLAEQRGVPTYFMHAGGNLSNRLQTLMIGRGDTFRFMPHVVSQWPRFAHVPCTAKTLSLVTDHYLELLRGKSVFVYSKTKSAKRFDARAHFGVGPGQKLLVATMGSYDEEVAAEVVGASSHRSVPLFPTQADWIKAVVAFVATRKDLFLIIRIHPREFPNRRDQALSQHARFLQESLQDLPSNAAVNWPTDGLSLYDLAEDTDVFLNSWSSVGKEMSMLGIPVVVYSDELILYPSDLNYLGTTQETYFSAIDKALADGWSSERIRQAYRWGVLEFVRACVFLGDSYPEVEHSVRSLPVKIIDRLLRYVDPYFKQRADCRKRLPQLSAAAQVRKLIESGSDSVLEDLENGSIEQVGLAEETLALRSELERLMKVLYPSQELRTGSRLYARLSNFALQK